MQNGEKLKDSPKKYDRNMYTKWRKVKRLKDLS